MKNPETRETATVASPQRKKYFLFTMNKIHTFLRVLCVYIQMVQTFICKLIHYSINSMLTLPHQNKKISNYHLHSILLNS
jgi:hypothetical protein